MFKRSTAAKDHPQACQGRQHQGQALRLGHPPTSRRFDTAGAPGLAVAHVDFRAPRASYTQAPQGVPPSPSFNQENHMHDVDGFVAAVPTANREAYLRHAEKATEIFREHGTLQVVETWGDDVPPGKLTSFPLAVQCKDDETVIFSWIT